MEYNLNYVVVTSLMYFFNFSIETRVNQILQYHGLGMKYTEHDKAKKPDFLLTISIRPSRITYFNMRKCEYLLDINKVKWLYKSK